MKIALGTAQFGMDYGVSNTDGQISLDEAGIILKHAKELKIDTLDTAIAYGESEKVLGKIGVEDFNIITKLPELQLNEISTPRYIENMFFSSLERLNVKKVYGLLLHRPSQLLSQGGREIYEEITKLKKNGFVKKIGISIYHPEELKELSEYYHFDLVQAPSSICDRRLINSGWLNKLYSKGIEIHIRSIFLQGLLLMNDKNRPEKFNCWDKFWGRWNDWLSENNLTALEATVRYAISIPEVSKVVIGINSYAQLKEILVASKGDLPDIPDELQSMDENLINPVNWNNL